MDLLRPGAQVGGTEGEELKAKHKAELELEGTSWGFAKFGAIASMRDGVS